jgi:DNA processing protein
VNEDLRLAVAFSRLPSVGGRTFRAGVEQHGSAAEAFRAYPDAAGRDEALGASDEILACASRRGIGIVALGDAAYPQRLLDLSDPPPLVFLLGTEPDWSRPVVGVVGTRQASPSGERIAHRMGALLASSGAIVVSGMALGIDAAAHRGAMDASGATVAILGGGVDCPYPPRHAALHARIAAEGLAMSEALPGSPPGPGAFPKRNRIIAALSDCVVVVEAGERSGALITARLALDLGRDVAAVPGPIDSPRHAGSNQLLSDGATFLRRAEDAVAFANLDPRPPFAEEQPAAGVSPVDGPERAIIKALHTGASDLDALAQRTRLTPRDVATAVTALELRGLLVLDSSGAVMLAG